MNGVRNRTVLLITMLSFVLGTGATGTSTGWAGESADRQTLKLAMKFAYGVAGPARPATIIAGESLVTEVRVSGISTGPDAKLDYTQAGRLLDSQGNVVMALPASRFNVPLFLGGSISGGRMILNIPRDMTPGRYLVQVESNDQVSGEKATRQLPIDVLPATTFGALNLRLAHDLRGERPAGASVAANQYVVLLCDITGYEAKDGRVNVRAVLTALDEKRRPVGSTPIIVPVTYKVPPWVVSSPSQRPIPLTFKFDASRPGKFILHLELEDLSGDNKVSYDLPFSVIAAKDFGEHVLASRETERQ